MSDETTNFDVDPILEGIKEGNQFLANILLQTDANLAKALVSMNSIAHSYFPQELLQATPETSAKPKRIKLDLMIIQNAKLFGEIMQDFFDATTLADGQEVNYAGIFLNNIVTILNQQTETTLDSPLLFAQGMNKYMTDNTFDPRFVSIPNVGDTGPIEP